MTDAREPFSGRFFGIFNVEGDRAEPIAMFYRREDADTWLACRQSLPADSDDHLDEYRHVFPVDCIGVWWNSYEPDPRANDPLGSTEVIAAYAREEP